MPRYDRNDPDWRVVKLTRAGHYIWRLLRATSDTCLSKGALNAALETIWTAKRELKAAIAVERQQQSAKLRERMNAKARLDTRPCRAA